MHTNKQAQFIALALAGKNIFLTGKAGTGKSFVVRELIPRLKAAGRQVAVIAPTGIAAINVKGQTIHSLFRLPPVGVLNFEAVNYIKDNKRRVLEVVDTFIIDEGSMLRPDVLDGMNYTLLKNGLPGLDQKQVIIVGDLKQLPPVLNENTRSVLYQTYNGDNFLYAKIMRRLDMVSIELDEIMRQSDPDFIEALNIVREGGKAAYFRQFVHKEPHGVVLAPHNATVAKYNEKGLAAQGGELYTFRAKMEGNIKATDTIFDELVQVKNGCRVMHLVNANSELVNGTLGIFVSHEGCHYIRVGDIDYAIEPATITKVEYVFNETENALMLEEIGSIEQMPVKLAYALSIHKSQGLTFPEITVDLTRACFQREQLYVALSRVTGPAGLRIITP